MDSFRSQAFRKPARNMELAGLNNINREVVMKKYGVVSCVFFLVVFFVLATVNTAPAQEVIKLKYTHIMPATHRISILSEEWCKEVEKRTNGRVKVTFFPGGTLVPPVQTYEGVVSGIADVGFYVQGYTPGRFPMTEVIYLPLGVKSNSQATKMINAWYDKFKPKEYDEAKLMYPFAIGPIVFASIKPLNSINDLKGMKIRSGGDSVVIVNAMGGVYVSIPMADSYDGFQRGVVEGNLTPAEVLKGWKFGDLMKGLLINEGVGAPQAFGVSMNKAKWNSLPPDIQKTIEQINKEWAVKTGTIFDELDKEGIEYGVSKGLKVVTVSKPEVELTKQKMRPLLDAHVEKMKKMGLSGEASLKFCLDFLKSNPK
jgi:TRAP-type transport system periplasmic protein